MAWTIPDTYTPYGDPDTVYWDDYDGPCCECEHWDPSTWVCERDGTTHDGDDCC